MKIGDLDIGLFGQFIVSANRRSELYNTQKKKLGFKKIGDKEIKSGWFQDNGHWNALKYYMDGQ